jgi:hypothetical protein
MPPSPVGRGTAQQQPSLLLPSPILLSLSLSVLKSQRGRRTRIASFLPSTCWLASLLLPLLPSPGRSWREPVAKVVILELLPVGVCNGEERPCLLPSRAAAAPAAVAGLRRCAEGLDLEDAEWYVCSLHFPAFLVRLPTLCARDLILIC